MKEFDKDYVPDSEEENEKKSMDMEKTKKKRSRDWRHPEELEFLKEMVRFSTEKKSDPANNFDSFLQFKRAEVGEGFSEIQLKNKIKSLQNRFNDENAKENVTVGSHQEEMLKFSNIIWGQKAESSVKRRRLNDEDEVIIGHTCFNELVKYHTKIASDHIGTVDKDFIVEAAVDLVEETTLQEWDQQWQEVKIQQMSVNATAAKVYHNQMQALVEALKKESANG